MAMGVIADKEIGTEQHRERGVPSVKPLFGAKRVTRSILSIGVQIPGSDIEHISLLSRRSLLDADIVVFVPGVPYTFVPENYQGKPCLSDDSSFHAKEALLHWKRELTAAVNAGKLVVVMLNTPQEVYVATGDKTHSGTGRNARVTRIVDLLSSYAALPFKCEYKIASGREMTLVASARFFSPYWSEFSKLSRYEVYLKGDFAEALVKTKTGNRTVGASLRKDRGAVLMISFIDFEDDGFVETRTVDGKRKEYWTKTALITGRKFVSALIGLADSLASEVAVTPPPEWTQKDKYRMPEEDALNKQIEKLTAQVVQIEKKRGELESSLVAAGSLRGLLYEQGKPLEHAVLESLRVCGFQAEGFRDSGSEFDAVFSSAEGRFIGEVERKDNKAINIDKFSQLERNISEDFAREGVSEHAKGLLFGNAFRFGI